MIRIAVWPVPTPQKIRPGATVLIDEIAAALVGAIRVPGIATPVPIRIRDVLAAASAIVA